MTSLNKIITILIITLFVLILFKSSSAHKVDIPHYRYKHKTEAIIVNPSIFNAKLKVKCDWNGKRWLRVKVFPLKRKSSVSISVPNGSRCVVIPSLW